MSNLQVRFPVVIDFAKNTYVEVEVTKRSRNGYIMEFYFLNQGKAIPKEDIGVVSLKATTEGGAIVFNDILLAEGEYVEYKISETILAEIGRSTCVLQLMDAEGNLINSFEWYVNVKTSLYDENAYVQQDDITAVRSYVLRAESAADKSEEHEKYLREVHANLGDLEEKLGVVKEDMEDYLQEVEEKVENGAFTGATGIQGPQGPQGETGPQGPQGEPGPQGASGITAPIAGHYVLSVEGGYLYVEYDGDTEPNFELDDEGNLYYVVSGKHKVQIGKVKGEKGDKGDTGEKGEPGEQGSQGEVGPIGENGKDGKTAYEYAKDGGYTGSEEMFAESLANATELETYKANSILSKASGEVVTTTDSAKVKPKNIKLFGKGKQNTIPGNQLLNIPINWNNGNVSIVGDGATFRIISASCDVEYSNLKVFDDLFCFEAGETYSINRKETYMHLGFWFYDSEGNIAETLTTEGTNNKTKTIPNDVVRVTMFFAGLTTGSSYDFEQNFMVNKGEPKDWEPFVGNEPSPSMNYPQIPEFLGESGSIGGKVLNVNVFNPSYRNNENVIWSSGCTVTENNGVFNIVATRADMYIWNNANDGVKYENNLMVCELMAIPSDASNISVKISNEEINKNFISYFDENKISLGEINSNSNEFTQKIKVGAKYFTLRFGKGDAVVGETYETTVMVNLGEPKDYEPYTEQPFTALTPNGLRGIPLGQTIPDAIKNSPIHMSGVYWDSVEQQYYIGDTKNENGKDVQRVLKVTIDGNSDVFDYNNPLDTSNIFGFSINGIVKDTQVLCDKLTNRGVWLKDINGIWVGANNAISIRLNNNLTGITTEDTSSQKVAKVKELLTNNPIEIYYWSIIDPIITGTTEEEKAQLDALVMNYPNTTIVNDAGAYMEVEYVCDTKEHIKQNYTPKSVTEDILERLGNVESQIALNS